METCQANGILRHACSKIHGLNKESCLAGQEIANDPSLTQAEIELTASGCEFVKSGEIAVQDKNQMKPPPTS